MWDQLIQEHVKQMNAIEQEMLNAHEDESRRYDEEVAKLETPKTKFSKDVLSMRHFLEKLIGAKRYSEAEAMTKRLEIQVKIEISPGFNILNRSKKKLKNGKFNSEKNSSEKSNCYTIDKKWN